MSRLSAVPEPDHDLLASKSRRLAELDGNLETALGTLDPVLASALSGGRVILTRDELAEVLRPGEALLAFRIGRRFSVASLNIRHERQLSTATIPLPDATFDGVGAAVSEILDAVKARISLAPQESGFRAYFGWKSCSPWWNSSVYNTSLSCRTATCGDFHLTSCRSEPVGWETSSIAPPFRRFGGLRHSGR